MTKRAALRAVMEAPAAALEAPYIGAAVRHIVEQAACIVAEHYIVERAAYIVAERYIAGQAACIEVRME